MRLIDADAVAEVLNDEITYAKQISASSQTIMGLKMGLAYINTATTIDAEPVRHGKWKPYTVRLTRSVKGGMYEKGLRCNLCNYKDGDYEYAYCPNCGAKMDEQ